MWRRRLFDKSSHEQFHVLFESNFHTAIDDYLAVLMELGSAPDKTGPPHKWRQ